MIDDKMMAVVTAGVGGYEVLEYREVATPQPAAGEVLIKVHAAGMNNTDINTRLAWYASDVTTGTGDAANQAPGADRKDVAGGWNGATQFPFIQGADCCGVVAAIGEDVDPSRIGQRVLVQSCLRGDGAASWDAAWFGINFDGAFAEYATAPASAAFPVECDWSDAELATIPCAFGTAENMLHRAGVAHGMTVLVTGASGGVGSAAVQLAKRRGAEVIAVCGREKMQTVADIGADRVLARDEDLIAVLGEESVHVVVDVVAGDGVQTGLRLLKRGGKLTSAGAIAAPMISIDMRTVYLKDLTLLGCTVWDDPVFANLIGYIERGEIKPLLADTFPLHDIANAQRAFLKKNHVGNFVLIPPSAAV